MMGWGWAPHGVLSLLVLILLLVGVAALIRAAVRGGQPSPPARRATALEILQERYARDELDREDYLRRKADILGRQD